MGIFTTIFSFFKGLGWRNTLLIGMAVALFFFVRARFFTPTEEQVQVTSLFQKIEYVEQLHLVTFFYEEIVAIGTSDRLQKLVDRAQEQVDDARHRVIFSELRRDSLKAIMERAMERFSVNDSSLMQTEQDYLAVRDTFERYDVSKFKKILAKLDSDEGYFGLAVRTPYRSYKNAETRLQARPRPRRAEERSLKSTQKDARNEIEARCKALREEWKLKLDRQKTLLKDRQRLAEKLHKDLKRNKNKAIKAYQKSEEEVLQIRGELERCQTNLQEAQNEFAQREGEPLPKLLVVVSAEVSGFVDLKDMRYEVEGNDSLTIHHMPRPQVDSVMINLSETKRFLADKSKSLFSTAEQGLYYEVYQQLKDALGETEEVVRAKAIASGIETETAEMAQAYIVDVGKSVGFKVGFAADETVPAAPAEELVWVDSVQLIADSLEQLIQDSLPQSLPDTLTAPEATGGAE